jgi:hypothetical protein
MVDDIAHRRIRLYRALVGSTVEAGRCRDLGIAACDAEDIGIEVLRELLQALDAVALRIHADEQHLDPLALGRRQGLQRQRGDGQVCRADIRAPGVPEIKQHDLAAQIGQADRSAPTVQREIAARRRLREPEPAVIRALGIPTRLPEPDHPGQQDGEPADRDERQQRSHGRRAQTPQPGVDRWRTASSM